MSIQSERVKKWRKNTKRKIFQAFGSQCGGCGYHRCLEALEFHHLDPSEKETYWGKISGHIRSWDYISKEMEKCVMLCSVCHKEVHAKFRCLSNDIQRFDQSLIEDDMQDLNVIIPQKLNKVVKNRYRNVDLVELMSKYNNYEQIGDMFGVTGAAIKRRIQYIQTGKY
jgi:hypothetical protein